MTKSMFFSWQDDTPQKIGHYFIKEAIQEALKKVKKELSLDERPSLDHDTKNIPGTPEILNTILQKISSSDVFIADITSIAKNPRKPIIPNPNVIFELGYATSRLGSERIILLINERYGSPAEGLPFDLRHKRWPIAFDIDLKSRKEIKKGQLKQLSDTLSLAIGAILKASPIKPNFLPGILCDHDKKLRTSFLEFLPSTSISVVFLRDYDVGNRFRDSKLKDIEEFLNTWTDAEHDFANEILQEKLINLRKALYVFNRELSQNTDYVGDSDLLTIGMRDFEDRPEIFEIQSKLNDLGIAGFHAHQELIRELNKFD